tara:strand:- start:1432 stop:1800 length:369 start_codon:yes stop_codon:yes gene_type:complete
VRKKKVKTKRRKIIKPKKSKKVVRVLPLNEKILSDDISKYPYVEIEWLDIEGDDGWSTLKILNQEKLPIAVSKGYLLSQKKGVTRIFRDYIKSKTKPVFEDIGSTVIIPTSVIISIKKIILD